MTLSRVASLLVLPAVLVAVALLAGPEALSQKKSTPPQPKPKKPVPTGQAELLLKPQPREKRPELPPSSLPLQFLKNERIALVGNSTAERFNLYGHFESLLHTKFPLKELVVRNFAFPADEVANRQRSTDYSRLDDPLLAFGPDTFFCFFGYNESFVGQPGVVKFIADYEKLLDDYAAKYPRDDAKSPPRFVLVSPIAFENTGDKMLPNGQKENENLKLYADAVKAVAEKRKLAFIDVFTPTLAAFQQKKGTANYTINGAHLNEAGDKFVGSALMAKLIGEAPNEATTSQFEKLRAAINDKSWIHSQDYRMLDGWYVYGGRRTYDTETFPLEYLKIRNMAAVRDQYVWDIAKGKGVAEKPDDSKTGDLHTPPTRFGQVTKSEMPEGPRILPPEDLIKTCTVPPGFEIKLFADEQTFPELAKPVQMNFDSKGRLWVSTMPSYPLWKPGDPKPSDKLVILEDTNGDGKADKSTVFYDKLQCPTGFEFIDGGVLVVDQPRILFLKDTDGDDKADVVIPILDGWATDDTHHTVGAFEFSPGGQLRMLEGVAMSTAVETPWGPFRNFGSSGGYVLDPRTQKISHFNTPGYGNPWCYVFNEWGQGFCGDGTGANQHWDTPLSGAQYVGRKGLNPVFNTEGMRPVVGSDFLVTRQFPDDVQGQFIYACVINMNGMPRWTFSDEGGGYKGARVRTNPEDPKTAFDLIKSTEKHFRPVDPMIGPDGALWFGDWANPLIGHMQYSQRDPNRDHVKGRIYRLVYKDKPLLKPVTQHGKPTSEILDQLSEYEWRTRYRVRAELRNRPEAEVLAAAAAWVSKLDPSNPAYDRLRCEALWIQQGRHAVDPALLKAVLKAKEPNARAAAVRIAADERDFLPDALAILKEASKDVNLRVTVEACRGLSYFPTSDSMAAILEALSLKGSDYFVQYTAEAALTANESAWRAGYLDGTLTKDKPEVKKLLDTILANQKKGQQLIPYLQILLGKDQKSGEERNKAMRAIADMKGGNATNGREVFRRTCIACHKTPTGEGMEYGPNMGDVDGKGQVGKRLTRVKLVESIIDPNADVEPKFQSTKIVKADGKTVIGLLVAETPTEVVIFDGKVKQAVKKEDIELRQVIKQSSMPEGMGGSLAPVEFLDVIEYLSTLK